MITPESGIPSLRVNLTAGWYKLGPLKPTGSALGQSRRSSHVRDMSAYPRLLLNCCGAAKRRDAPEPDLLARVYLAAQDLTTYISRVPVTPRSSCRPRLSTDWPQRWAILSDSRSSRPSALPNASMRLTSFTAGPTTVKSRRRAVPMLP